MSSSDTWTIGAALEWTSGYLARKGDEHPRLSAEWLIAEACKMRRVELYVSLDKPLTLRERDVLRSYVSRRGTGEPLQYITGEVPFRHIVVKVQPGVLIPRPETEVLVSEALPLLPKAPRRVACDVGFEDVSVNAPLVVADICTGTGCIACSIAHEHPNTRVIATDISSVACKLACENVETLGLSERVDVIECDLGEGISEDMLGTFDLVVSNPPYIPTDVLATIPREVADFEPQSALDGGADGLDYARRIMVWAFCALRAGGGLALELHETALDTAADFARELGFVFVRIVADLAGRPRVLVARKPESNT